MKSKPSDIALLESALLAIEKVLAHADSELQEGPGRAADPGSGIADTPSRQDDAQRFRASAAQSAVNVCLSAAAALVDVSQALMRAPGDRSWDQLRHEWQALITHTKIASRSAHRAALIMAAEDDPLSARGIEAAPLHEARAASFAH